jgi:hypothetical protein
VVTQFNGQVVEERFKAHHSALRVVLDDRTLHLCMFFLVGRTEQMIGNFTIDNSTVVLVKLSLEEYQRC